MLLFYHLALSWKHRAGRVDRRGNNARLGALAVVASALACASWTLADRSVAAPVKAGLPEHAARWLDRSFPPELGAQSPPELPEQPLLQGVSLWDGSVVAMGSRAAYRVDLETRRLVPIAIPGCPGILDLQEAGATLYALCSGGEALYLMTRPRRAGAPWRTALDLSQDTDFLLKTGGLGRMAVSDRGVFVFGATSLRWRHHSEADWKKRDLPMPEAQVLSVLKMPPTIAAATAQALFFGWDLGEYGGWLYQIEVDSSGRLSGSSELVGEIEVNSIIEDRKGRVWIAGGLTHLGLVRGRVLVVRDGSVQTVLDERNFEKVADSVSLRLPRPDSIHGLTLDPEGRILAVAGELGVFELSEDSLTHLVKGRMAVTFVEDRIRTTSYPAGIVATEEGILVASRALGVFAFLRSPEGYEFAQIVR